MSDPTRGITCPDMRRIVREALSGGWEWAGFSGTTHARIRWRDGTILQFGTTPSVASWKSLATDIKKISGNEVWRKGNRKRSHKAFRSSGFSIVGTQHNDAMAARITALNTLHRCQRSEWDALVANPTREAAQRARLLLTEIHETEAELERLYQPVDRITS